MKLLLFIACVVMTVSAAGMRNVTVYMGSRPEILALYGDDGKLQYAFPCATGMRGFDTPAKHWTAVAKNSEATSNKYHADMPFAVRLGPSYDGYNLHYDPIGDGSPVSHGCIRQSFKVFMWTQLRPAEDVYTVSDAAPASVKLTDPFNSDFTRLFYLPGDSDSGVKTVQQMLVHADYMSSDAVTGVYDDNTVASVKKYQADNGLAADGKAGIATMQKLMKWLNYGY